jgi:hypothetical protein
MGRLLIGTSTWSNHEGFYPPGAKPAVASAERHPREMRDASVLALFRADSLPHRPVA